ncbi:protein of unknown function [Pseudomonas sp. JV241A]|nr:protein of unknown function [Pseudomonas sp. JV241A]
MSAQLFGHYLHPREAKNVSSCAVLAVAIVCRQGSQMSIIRRFRPRLPSKNASCEGL